MSLSASERTVPWDRLKAPLLSAAAVGLVTVALHLRDPHVPGSWGFCPWLALTGTYCPGCGGLRAVNDLTHGDLLAAASSNVVLVAAIPLVIGLWLAWCYRAALARPRWLVGRRGLAASLTLAGVLVAFWVLRNLPALAWLAP